PPGGFSFMTWHLPCRFSPEGSVESQKLYRPDALPMESCTMLGRIVEIEGEGRRLSLHRGLLTVAGPDGPLGQVPLDDIEAVILSNPAASFTSQSVTALASRGAPLVVCGNDYRPAAWLLPVDGHLAQGDRIEA